MLGKTLLSSLAMALREISIHKPNSPGSGYAPQGPSGGQSMQGDNSARRSPMGSDPLRLTSNLGGVIDLRNKNVAKQMMQRRDSQEDYSAP